MRVLILGGTLFLGRALAEAALTRGHAVTLFNRGNLHDGVFGSSVERLRGDRNSQLEELRNRSWDIVIDTSGYVPRIVRASAELLRDWVDRYVFVSSISAYATFSEPFDEDAPLARMPDPTAEEVTGQSYGPLKALAEQAVREVFGNRALLIRPGLIVGPHDPTVRFSYWTARAARGGDILAPGDSTTPVQLIDVRDLADWIVRLSEARQVGVFNATGPASNLTLGQVLDACVEASESDGRLHWVDQQWLEEQGVLPWQNLPLWMPFSISTHRHFFGADIDKAVAAGLTFRPLVETARDTLAWQLGQVGSPPEKYGAPMPDRTLSAERERELLSLWSANSGNTAKRSRNRSSQKM